MPPHRPDDPEAEHEPLRLRSAAGRIALTATIAASAMSMLDATVVNVALPAIADDLDVGVGGLQWVITGYLLTLASLILLGGALGDRYGRRKVFLIGTVWFAAASLLCGLAPNLGVLVAARMLQGIGAALLTPGSLALIQASFHPDDRAPAVGAWSGLGGIAGALGPFVGGSIIDGPGWRWVFLINVPVAAVVLLCSRALPESRERAGARGFDVAGAVLVGVGLVAATWALDEAGRAGGSGTLAAAAAVVGVACLAAFVIRVRRTPNPLVPPSLFESRVFTVLNVATFVLYGALGAAFFLIAYELQVVSGWSALAAGAALVPSTLIMLVASAASGRLAQRIGPKPQLVIGPLLVAAGMVLLAGIDEDASWAVDVLPGSIVFGVGLVTFVAPLTATVMASADDDHVSIASGVNNAVARTGGLAAVAAVPLVSGLVAADGASEVQDAYVVAMVITAGLAVVAAAISLAWLRRAETSETDRDVICPVDGTPLLAASGRTDTAA